MKSLSFQGSGNSVPRILSKQVSFDTGHRTKTRKALRENCRKSMDGGSFQKIRRSPRPMAGPGFVDKGKLLDPAKNLWLKIVDID